MSTVTEYRPSEDEEYMNPAQISYFEKRLRGRKEELQAVTKAMKNALRQSLLKGPDLFDVASSQIDLSIGLEDLERNLRQLMQINKALERIQQGEYGYCDMTGDMIGLKRPFVSKPKKEWKGKIGLFKCLPNWPHLQAPCECSNVVST